MFVEMCTVFTEFVGFADNCSFLARVFRITEIMVAKSDKSVGYRWKIDFSGRAKNSWHNPPSLANPIGYCDDFERVPDHEQEDNNAHLIVKRSWDIALVPLKQVSIFDYLDFSGPKFLNFFV